MPTHDCANCESSSTCPLESIAPWLNEHEEEVSSSMEVCATTLRGHLKQVTCSNPVIMLAIDEIKHLVTTSFIIGYHGGRTHTEITKVLKDTE